MTDAFKRLSLLALLALSACASPSPQDQEVDRSPPAIGSSAEQRILVTFTDRSINRPPLAEAPGMYRPRGHYQSTTWSRQTSERLASDYHLRQITEWPIVTLGVHCVVYELAPNQRLEEIVNAVQHDRRIESVQPMNVFRVLSDDPYYRLQKGLRSMKVHRVHRWVTGRNVTIAIIDTGVDINHPRVK